MKRIQGIAYVVLQPKHAAHTLPVLMIHGHGGNHEGLTELGGLLNRQVYIPDLPGFGVSAELSEHSMENYAKALKSFIRELDIKQYDLIGHSLGSAIALQLAATDKRVKKLVLLNPVPAFHKVIKRMFLLMSDASERIPEQYTERLIHAHLYNLGTFLINSRRRGSIKQVAGYLKHQSKAKYSLKAWRETGNAIYNLDQYELATHISCPTLLLHGDKDKLTTLSSIEEFKDKFSDARLERFAKTGHFMHMEQPADVAQSIAKFLDI